jgi:hypothetical protein
MKEFKIPQKLIGLVTATLKHVKYRVKVPYNLLESFGIPMGLMQEDALSCI